MTVGVNTEHVRQNRRRYLPIRQTWDFHIPCLNCGFISLSGEQRNKRDRCICYYASPEEYPAMQPLPECLLEIYLHDIEHFGRMSSYYNNILSISATGVEHGPEGSGWERIIGDHAVKLHGRTYHFLPPTGGAGGLSYFTFDALQSAIAHGESLNGEYLRVNNTYLQTLFGFLQTENMFVRECQMIGNQVTDLTVSLNEKTCIFDVAAVTSVHPSGDRVLKYII